MAKKAVKKPAAKSAKALKSAPVAAPVAKTAAVSRPTCNCKGGCAKKVLLFVIAFALGFGVCCAYKGCCKKKFGGVKGAEIGRVAMFDEKGCLKDTSKLTAEQVETAKDENGCISRESFRNLFPKPTAENAAAGTDRPKPRRRVRAAAQAQ
ncbi:MAG: hypothetical protein LBB23_03515 [Rickettsiales bacterium]|nr:hypothetical protein [Rickettsiales bacterium]